MKEVDPLATSKKRIATSRNNTPAAASPLAEPPAWLTAVRAAESKKATDIKVLDLQGHTSIADYFVICTGANVRQLQAIADEVHLQMKQQAGKLPLGVEGYEHGEWILADYGDIILHMFQPQAREYYDLERLWKMASVVEIPPEPPQVSPAPPPTAQAAPKRAASRQKPT